MLPKKITDKWRNDYDRQLTLAENSILPIVKRFYKKQYYKGVDYYIKNDNINVQDVFKIGDIQDMYLEIIPKVCMRFAVWYFRNSDKYEEKKSPRDYTRTWKTAFNHYAGQKAATNVTSVSNTAKKSLMSVIQKLYRDPDFITLGAAQRARILRKQFDKYSKFQAMRLVRTESLRGANYGIEQSALQVYAGRTLKKQWVTFFDNKTRDWHAAAHNQTVDFDKPFEVDTELIQRPGEGSARNVVNCRCSMVPFPADVETSLPFQ
jgi:hypothetical protein